jgi:hypothetical protein
MQIHPISGSAGVVYQLGAVFILVGRDRRLKAVRVVQMAR